MRSRTASPFQTLLRRAGLPALTLIAIGFFGYNAVLGPTGIMQTKQTRAEYEQKKQNQYRSKQQRAESAKKRLRISELEKEIEALEVTIFNLENEIADPEIASHFELMSEKCKELEAARTSLDEKMDEWASLED